jgi:CHAT domain-containing protein
MADQALIQHLLELPDPESRKRFLAARAPLLDDDLASALKQQADHFLRADIGQSFVCAELLFALAEVQGNPLHRALGLLAEANARSIGLGEYQAAVDLYDEAAGTYRRLGRVVEQARSQVGKIPALTKLGRYAEAEEVGSRVSHVLQEHGEWRILAGVKINLGVLYSRAGDDARSLEMFDQAGELYRRLGTEGEAFLPWIEQNRAIALRALGRFDASIQASQAARETLQRMGQDIEAARARQNLALTYVIQGRYNEALAHLDAVRQRFLADGRQRDAMLVDAFVSDCLLQLGRFRDVLDTSQRVRATFARLGTPDFMARAIANEGVAYTGLGRYDDALDSLREARQIFEREGNAVAVASVDLQIASVLHNQHLPAESYATAEACAHVFRSHDLPLEEAQACLVAARAALAQERYAHALDLASRALETGEERHIPTITYQSQHLLGALALAQGDPQAALDAFDRAIEEVERLRGRLMVEFRVGFAEDKERIYEDAVGLCLDLGDPSRGLQYAERAKSRALLDLLAQRVDLSVRVRDAADSPLVEELLHLRHERDRLLRRWEVDAESRERGWSPSAAGGAARLQDVATLEKQITDLWHRLLIRNADYAREAALHTVRWEPAQPYLDADTLLVEYYAIRDRLVVFLVTRDDVRALRLACELAPIQRLIQLLWLNLRSVPRSDPQRLASLRANAEGLLQRLHLQLIAPLASELSAHRRLVVVPHGPLHYLPFHALHDGTSYLLEQWEIGYLPGSSFLRYTQETPVNGSGLLAVGHSGGGRLPYTVQEAQAVATQMAGHALLEEEATLAQVRQAMPQHGALHLAAHGDFRADNPLFSGLALADGWLTTLDIFSLRLQASLVTLSACQTGRSVVGGGDELLGLMRAFLGVGAASLVLSLWAVEDRSTAQLMACFYRKLAQGWAKGQALRQAQLACLQGQADGGDGLRQHPYFWASFFLVGDAGPL